MESTHSLKASLTETAQALRGDVRRNFMARTCKEQGAGGKRRSARELGWSHATFRKGTHELERGFTCLDVFSARDHKRAEAHLPQLHQPR